MSETTLDTLRSSLIDRFTSMAVEVFGEVESIVEAYCEENKRLRNLLHMVVSPPEIKLPRLDLSQFNGATIDVKELLSQPSTNVNKETSEPLTKKPKEEEIESEITRESEQQEGAGQPYSFIIQDYVKKDPEEDGSPCPIGSLHIQVVDHSFVSSATLSPNKDEPDDGGSSSTETVFDDDGPDEWSLSEFSAAAQSSEDTTESQEHPSHHFSKTCDALQKTMLEFPRMIPCESLKAEQLDCHSFLHNLAEAFKDMPDDKKPLITTMGLTSNVEYVDSAFGKVPKGSPLSYQYPVPSLEDCKPWDKAPPQPPLPLSVHTLYPASDLPTLSAKEHECLTSLYITWTQAHYLEQSTRGREEHRSQQTKRLTSHFRDICTLKPGQSDVKHMILKIKKGLPKNKAEKIQKERKIEAIWDYCRHMCVNWYSCGLVVNPVAPWLGAFPDGLVYDPKEESSFGLLHTKCITLQTYMQCKFLTCRDGFLQLQKTHSCYWNIQGEMLVTGTSWCDLLVACTENFMVQRIYRDEVFIKAMKKKLDDFFFFHYLPSLLS